MGKKKKPEEDIKIAVDTSVQDAMKARLAGLKKKDEKEEEPAEEVGPSEEELKKQEHDAARLAAEKANMDKLQADIKAAEEAFLKSQTARQGADIIAEGAEALGELDAMAKARQEEYEQQKAELEAKKKALEEA